MTTPPTPEPDPRRWVTLVIVLSAVLIAALDATVLNIAIPTILREFDTTLPQLQWVITGYSLTFAALLIIGGRLADVYGAKRMFMIGAGFFAVGSLVAALSTGVGMLVIGEAVIEGMGASLMLPATLGILTSSFQGRERATAFAAWGAVMGAAMALGPTIGGFLTSYYSWRWAFVINVIVAPAAILGAVFVMREVVRTERRERIDVPGALLIATGMVALVFAISEGGTYGWWRPLGSFTIGGAGVWPVGRPVSVVPVAFAVSVVLLSAFVVVERRKEAAGTDPLFEFSTLRRLRFRYGLATLLVLAMGQVAFLLVVSVFLQDGRRLSAFDTGLWLVPSGIGVVLGSQLGSRLTHRIGTTNVVRLGLALEAVGLAVTALVMDPAVNFLALLPGFALFSVGIGFGGSQLTNVILSDVPVEKSGAASGANSTVRMIGGSLGIAIMSALLSTLTVRHAVSAVRAAPAVGAGTRARAVAAIRAGGVSFRPPRGASPGELVALREAVTGAIATAARAPLLVAAALVGVGLVLSLLIPQPAAEDGTEPARAGIEHESELLVEAISTQ